MSIRLVVSRVSPARLLWKETVLVKGRPEIHCLKELAATSGADATGLLFTDTEAQCRWWELTGDTQFRASEHRIRIP